MFFQRLQSAGGSATCAVLADSAFNFSITLETLKFGTMVVELLSFYAIALFRRAPAIG